jgi:hypothetical protein
MRLPRSREIAKDPYPRLLDEDPLLPSRGLRHFTCHARQRAIRKEQAKRMRR